MTIETLRGKAPRGRSRSKPKHADLLVIGEQDSNIFNCPSCARPLGVGASRCPECGIRLIAGVQAARAVTFLGLGWVLGAMIGAGVMGGFLMVTRPADVAVGAVPAAIPSAAPVASVLPAASQVPAVAPGIPPAALSALRQTTVINGRIVAGAERLELALETGGTVEIARALRALAADAAFGDRLAVGLGDWSTATGLATDLGAFYNDVGAIAHEGLSASLANTRAYVRAGDSMLDLVAGLTALDASSRDLATVAGFELPPIGDTAAP